MASPHAHRDGLLRLFADILDYPTAGLVEAASRCEELVEAMAPEAAAQVRAFRTYAAETPMGHLEEVYTGFFDLNPVCHPYVGYQLFGESYKRSSFLLELKELYRAEGFQADENELPDRLSVMLRFVAESRDEEAKQEMITEGLLPALDRITRSTGETPRASAVELVDDGIQLEGHSQGEVLTGGFVLALTEEDSEADPSKLAQHPYYQTLRALRTVLERIWPADTAEQSTRSSGGANHD